MPLHVSSISEFDKRGFCVKAESTPGIFSTPTTSDNAFQLLDGTVMTEFDKKERNRDRAFFTGKKFKVTNKRATVKGGFELPPPTTPGAASTPGLPSCSVVLLPCGMTETRSSANSTTILSPISTGIPTVSFQFEHGGTGIDVRGSRGDISSLRMAIGEVFMGELSLTGKYDTVDEQALSSYTLVDIEPTDATDLNTQMRFYLATTNAIPQHLNGKSLTINFGNDLKQRQFTQYADSKIAGRSPTFEVVCARPDDADIDFWALRDAETEVCFDFSLVDEDDTRYSRLKVRGQIENISIENVDGDALIKLTGVCVASSTGGDEFSIEFGLDSLRLIGDFPDGADNTAYSAQLALCGLFEAPIVYSVQSGTIPTGLTLNTATGVISGADPTPGTYNFVIRATDANSVTADSSAQEVTIAA